MDVDTISQSSSNRYRYEWNICGWKVTRSAIVFLCQIVILYIAIITCFVNLSIKNGPTELWISILSLGLGSILPSPKVNKTPTAKIQTTTTTTPTTSTPTSGGSGGVENSSTPLVGLRRSSRQTSAFHPTQV